MKNRELKNFSFIYTKIEPSVVRENRKFYQKQVRKSFIRWCAYKGYFNNVFSKSEIKQAKKGNIPEWCSIHHMRPLSGEDEGVNSFENLTVISNTEHKRINKTVYLPQLESLNNAPYGTQTVISVPKYDFVDEYSLVKDRPDKLKPYEIMKSKKFQR